MGYYTTERGILLGKALLSGEQTRAIIFHVDRILKLIGCFALLAITIVIIMNGEGKALTLNTVSLKYIMQEKFNGRDLRFVKVLATSEAYTRYYITYMSGKLKISGIMNVPKGKGPYPVIITAHGFVEPQYYTTGRGLKREQDYLARKGYVVIHPDYRNHNGSDKDPDNNMRLNLGYTEDVINAAYAVKNSGFKFMDRNNIGLLGHSLGGGIALNIMVTKPKLIKAYVLFAPISIDFRDNYYRWIAKKGPYVMRKFGPPWMRDRIEALYGSPRKNPAFWDGISPKTYLRNVEDPAIVHQGLADKEVPPVWSDKLVEAFKKNGKAIRIYTYKGQPHEFTSAWPRVMRTSTVFFDAILKH
jgi:dipeptidyl aminopeptidase/acylaminoacyl peptidase